MAPLSLAGLALQLLVQSSAVVSSMDGWLAARKVGGLTAPPSPPKTCNGSTCTVHDAAQLVGAVKDTSVRTIVATAGVYNLTEDMCKGPYGDSTALCIGRNLTIRAEANGTVVLDAMGQRRVVYVSGGGSAELVGINITGGKADDVSARLHAPSQNFLPAPRWNSCTTLFGRVVGSASTVVDRQTCKDATFTATLPMMYPRLLNLPGTFFQRPAGTLSASWCSQGGGLHINGNAELTNCNIYGNQASKVALAF